MNWLQIALAVWLAGQVIIPPVLYILYGFAMSAKVSNDKGLSPPHVYRVDAVIAIVAVIIDGAYNAFWLSVLCLDLRPKYAFKWQEKQGVWFFELVTERLSHYNETPSEWAWRRWVARTVAPFLDGKDPKGRHVRQEVKT